MQPFLEGIRDIVWVLIALYTILELIGCFSSRESREAAESSQRFVWRLAVALLLALIYHAL